MKPACFVLREAAANDRAQRLGHIAASVERSQVEPAAAEPAIDDGKRARERFEHHDAEGPEVAARIDISRSRSLLG